MGRLGNTGICTGTLGNKQESFSNNNYHIKYLEALEKSNGKDSMPLLKKEYVISIKPKGIGKMTQKKLLKGVKNIQLTNAIKQLYREDSVIGDGGTSAVLRYEAKYNVKLSKTGHLQKAYDYLSTLNNIKTNYKLSNKEVKIINKELGKLKRAIKYYKEKTV